MRLLQLDNDGNISITGDRLRDLPPYAILSHTWGSDDDEVTYRDISHGEGKDKPGYRKILFCGEQAARDRLSYFWVDTCCIDKANNTELSTAINSMFRWYQNAAKCYVYMADVSTVDGAWEPVFWRSRWFKRCWTLQELIAPPVVKFFTSDGNFLGDKNSLEGDIHGITGIPTTALRGRNLVDFSVDERLSWAKGRECKQEEDEAYSLLGIFNIYLSLIYAEGKKNAFRRLRIEIDNSCKLLLAGS